ncbi:MAG: inositol monophosphatase, partial [Clostridiaceae bacterium]|nr:inositol monophosphatase [Clostridiaceae bacterium]
MNQLKGIILEAGALISDVRLSADQISSKAGRLDFVTKYDVEVQNFLEQRFFEKWPGYQFIGEEQEKHDFEGNAFIVDPIDGTTNFILGV